MRRVSLTLALSTAFTSALIAVPSVSAPAAAAAPVAPRVHTVPLRGLDTAALAAAPAPEAEEVPAGTSEPAWRPVAMTGRTSSEPFSAVGVTWAQDPGVDVAVQVRTRAGGRWSDWTEIEVQANSTGDPGSPEAASPRAGSDPLYVGPSDGVQVRVDSGAVKPRDLQLALIDPGTSAADATAAAGPRTLGGAVAEAATPLPSYVTRAQWGADESLRNCDPRTTPTIKGGILHTTATGNDYTASQSAAVMRSMYAYHTKTLGWCDIGYNFLVDKFGTLFEGRYGGVSRAILGTHTGGFNSYTFGVSMIGNHDLVRPSTAMLATVEKVFAYKLGLYGLNPQGTTTYTSAGGSATKYPAGTVVTRSVISGHRDYSTKSCPGNYAYPLLPSIRAAVAARMGGSLPQPTTGTAATTVSLRTSPATLTYGRTATVSGRLATASGTSLSGRTVRLYVRKQGTTSWSLLATRTTSSSGSFSAAHAARTNVDYRATYAGSTNYAAARRDVRMNVAPAVSASLSASSVRLGGRVVLRGTVKPAHAGQSVVRQQLVGGTWTTLATNRLSTTGTYSFSVKPVSRGTKSYRVVKPADADHTTGRSATRTLSVS